MSSPFRSWAPPPMPDVPFMPKAQVGPQQIALGLPQSAPPAPAAPPPYMPTGQGSGGGFFATPGGAGVNGGYFNSPTTQIGQNGWLRTHPPASAAPAPSIHPQGFGSSYQAPMQMGGGGFGSSYQSPMQLAAAQQTAQAGQPQHTFNPQLANLGLGLMGGRSVTSMLPQIMQMWRNK